MEEIKPIENSEGLRAEENISDIGDSVSPSEIAESVSPEPVEPVGDYYPQCRLSDEDVERIAKSISKNIVDTLKGDSE